MLKTMTRSVFEFVSKIERPNDVITDRIWANLGKYFETVKYLSYFDKKNIFGTTVMSKLEYLQKVRPQ